VDVVVAISSSGSAGVTTSGSASLLGAGAGWEEHATIERAIAEARISAKSFFIIFLSPYIFSNFRKRNNTRKLDDRYIGGHISIKII
jgi:hypothetical protein